MLLLKQESSFIIIFAKFSCNDILEIVKIFAEQQQQTFKFYVDIGSELVNVEMLKRLRTSAFSDLIKLMHNRLSMNTNSVHVAITSVTNN